MNEDYILTLAEKSFCPDCMNPVTLLGREDCTGGMFWICFPCQKVYEVGIGEVPKERRWTAA